MKYIVKKIHFNSFQERIILETEANTGSFSFETRVELPIEALNRLVNNFQQSLPSLSFYDYLQSEKIAGDVYYKGLFYDFDWILEAEVFEAAQLNYPRKICA